MIDMKDLVRPPVLLALAGSAAVGFAVGYLVGRDPQLLRRVLAAAARSWEQTTLAVAEAREDLADQWAEAREAARRGAEDAAFAAAAGAASAAAVEEEPEHIGEAAAEPAPKPRRRARAASPRRTARTTRTTH